MYELSQRDDLKKSMTCGLKKVRFMMSSLSNLFLHHSKHTVMPNYLKCPAANRTLDETFHLLYLRDNCKCVSNIKHHICNTFAEWKA